MTATNVGPASTQSTTLTPQVGQPPSPSANSVTCYFGPPSSPLQTAPTWMPVCLSMTPAAFSLPAGTNTVPLFILPGGGVIHAIKILPRIAFTAAGLTTYTLSVGTQSNPTQLASAFSLTGIGTTVFQLSTNFIEYDYYNPTFIVGQAISAGVNLNAVSVGVVDVYALLSTAAPR